MFDFKPPTIDWLMIAPVSLVILTGIVVLIVEMFRPNRNNNGLVIAGLIGLGISAGSVIAQFFLPDGVTFGDMVVRDREALALQLLLIGVCFFVMLFSEGYLREKRIPFAEFYPLAIWSTAGAMIMVSTESLLMLFLGLEIMSIALYCLAGISRQESKSEESAMKYFLLGAFATAFFLYGIAFVYGASGSIHMDGIGRAWTMGSGTTHVLLIFGLGLMLVGLLFKAAMVPFHQWTPDVYQGSPTNVGAFMATIAKIGAIGALFRLLDAMIPVREVWLPFLFWIAIATMTVANLAALVQTDVKRALGYSSIANAGYLLVALLSHMAAPDEVGIGTMVLYLTAYSFMTLGAFLVVSLTAHGGREGTKFSDLNGMWQRAPLAAFLFVVFIASLIGVPPTAGFFGKLFIFNDAVTAGLTPLAIMLAINSAISAFYYLGMVRAAFVADEPRSATATPFSGMHAGWKATAIACALGVVLLSLFASPILDWINTPIHSDTIVLNAGGAE